MSEDICSLKCRSAEELNMDELSTELIEGISVDGKAPTNGIKGNAKALVDIIVKIGAEKLLKVARLHSYKFTMEDKRRWAEFCPSFWTNVLGTCSSGIQLSLDELQELSEATRGSEDGVEVSMKTIYWLKLERFIRRDIIKENYKLLSYLDKHLGIIESVFEEGYERIDFDISENRIWCFLNDRLPTDQFRVLYNEVFRAVHEEADGIRVKLTGTWERTLEVVYYNLGMLKNGIILAAK